MANPWLVYGAAMCRPRLRQERQGPQGAKTHAAATNS